MAALNATAASSTTSLTVIPGGKNTTHAKALKDAAGLFGDVPDPAKCEETAQFPLSHMGLGQRVLAHFGDRIAYRESSQRWYVYNGIVWLPDPDLLHAKALVRTVIRSMSEHEADYAAANSDAVRVAAQMLEDVEDMGMTEQEIAPFRRRVAQAKKSAKDSVLTAALSAEKSAAWILGALEAIQQQVTVAEPLWDKHELRVNGPNGTYDVADRVLRKHDASDYITKVTAVPIDLGATSVDVDKALAHLERQHAGYREAMVRWSGYSLTRITDAKAFVSIVGPPNAAKSTWAEGFYYAAGGAEPTAYGTMANPKCLSVERTKAANGHSDELDRLKGYYFVILDEAEHIYVDGDLIKQMCAGGILSTSGKGKRGTHWPSWLKPWLIGNGRSRFATHDDGIITRLVPFDVSKPVPAGDFDPQFKHRLLTKEENLKAILAAALRGASDWYEEYQAERRNGHADPAKAALRVVEGLEDARAAYVADANPLTWFFENFVVVGDEAALGNDGRADTATWVRYYNSLAPAHGRKKMDSNEFGRYLNSMGHETGNPTDFTLEWTDPRGVGRPPVVRRVQVRGKKFRKGMRFGDMKDWRVLMQDYSAWQRPDGTWVGPDDDF